MTADAIGIEHLLLHAIAYTDIQRARIHEEGILLQGEIGLIEGDDPLPQAIDRTDLYLVDLTHTG